jgi:hypothetical protein
VAPAAVNRPHHPANWYTPNNIISAPAATTAGLIYFPGIGGSQVLPSNDGSLATAVRRASSCFLLADVITVTPHSIFKRVHPACAVLKDARLCEVVDNLWRHSKASGQGVG